MLSLADRIPADPTDADALVAAFTGWAEDRGLSLYPHQEEAILELVTGEHVILATPTGSGKSLVATAAHFIALAQAAARTTPPRSRRWCRRSSSPWSRRSARPTSG